MTTTPAIAPIPGTLTIKLGKTGLKNIQGRVNEEYHQLLRSWAREVEFYIEMRDAATVSTALAAVKLPLLGAEFDVEAGAEGEANEVAANWLWDNMNGMTGQTWRSHTSDALEAIDFGFEVSEITLRKRETDGRLWLDSLDPRGQETLENWEFEDDRAVTFVQRDPNTGGTTAIPLAKCLHFTLNGRKNNPQGRSMLRSIWRTWRFLADFENLEGIGVERNVGGMPLARIPKERLESGDITALVNALKALRMDEDIFMIIDNETELAPYAGGSMGGDIGAIITRKKQEILGRFFAQFLMLGMDSVGTQALVKGSTDFFSMAARSFQTQLLEVWNAQLVPFLFAVNRATFPQMTALPRIVWREPGKADIEALATVFERLVNLGVVQPQDSDEAFFRDAAGLPEAEADRETVELPEVDPEADPALVGAAV